MLTGTLLTESLRVGAVVALPDLVVTRMWRHDVSRSARGNQPSVWTFLHFQAPDDRADDVAAALTEALLPNDWYADFEVGDDHVVVFAGKSFRYRKNDDAARQEAVAHARSIGIPEHQLDWGD